MLDTQLVMYRVFVCHRPRQINAVESGTIDRIRLPHRGFTRSTSVTVNKEKNSDRELHHPLSSCSEVENNFFVFVVHVEHTVEAFMRYEISSHDRGLLRTSQELIFFLIGLYSGTECIFLPWIGRRDWSRLDEDFFASDFFEPAAQRGGGTPRGNPSD